MNLLELVQAQLPEDRLARLATLVGESATGTRKALWGGALPAILAGLSSEYSGEAGAARLLDQMRAGGHDGALLANLDGALAGGAHAEALLNLGKGQLGSVLGDRIDAVTELIAAETGIRRSSASALLGLVVPVVLGTIGKQLQSGGGASRIAELLAGARPALAPLASPGLAAALGVANLAAPAAAPSVPTRQGAVWPWLIVPAVALAMFFSLRSCQQNSMRATSDAVPAAPAQSPVAAGPQGTAPAATTRETGGETGAAPVPTADNAPATPDGEFPPPETAEVVPTP